MGFRFKRRETAAEGARRVARERLVGAIEAMEDRGRDAAEAVHCVRKQFKKARAVVRLVREALGEEAYRRENDGFRDLGRRLGAARDAVVVVRTLDAVIADDASLDIPAVRRVRERLAKAAEELQPHRRGRGFAAEARAVVDTLREAVVRIDAWPIDDAGLDVLLAGVGRSYKRGRRNMRRAYEAGDAHDSHEWRKRVKDLWYQLRLMRRASPKRLDKAIERVGQLAELLGEDHDLAEMLRRAEEAAHGEADALQPLRLAVERRRGELARKAKPIGKRVYADKPRRFVARLRRDAERRGFPVGVIEPIAHLPPR